MKRPAPWQNYSSMIGLVFVAIGIVDFFVHVVFRSWVPLRYQRNWVPIAAVNIFIISVGYMLTYSKSKLRREVFFFLELTALIMLIILWNIIPPLCVLGVTLHILFLLTVFFILMVSIFVRKKIVQQENDIASWKLKLLGIAQTVLALLLILELPFRIIPIYDSSDMNPAVKFFWPDWVYSPLNQFGHRDRPFETVKKPDTFRVIVLGDSYVEGAGIRREDTFCRVLERELNKRLARESSAIAEVYNLGHCGMNTHEEVLLASWACDTLSPDMIILSYVFNDAEQHPDPIKVIDTPWWMNKIHLVFLKMIGSYAYYFFFINFTLFHGNVRSGVDVYVDQHADDYPGFKAVLSAFWQLRNLKTQRGISVVCTIFPIFQYPYPPEFIKLADKVLKVMQSYELPAIDLYHFYKSKCGNLGEFALGRHDAHPNVRANMLLGEYLVDYIWNLERFKVFREARPKLK